MPELAIVAAVKARAARSFQFGFRHLSRGVHTAASGRMANRNVVAISECVLAHTPPARHLLVHFVLNAARSAAA
jgi:hypothetical protein